MSPSGLCPLPVRRCRALMPQVGPPSKTSKSSAAEARAAPARCILYFQPVVPLSLSFTLLLSLQRDSLLSLSLSSHVCYAIYRRTYVVYKYTRVCRFLRARGEVRSAMITCCCRRASAYRARSCSAQGIYRRSNWEWDRLLHPRLLYIPEHTWDSPVGNVILDKRTSRSRGENIGIGHL